MNGRGRISLAPMTLWNDSLALLKRKKKCAGQVFSDWAERRTKTLPAFAAAGTLSDIAACFFAAVGLLTDAAACLYSSAVLMLLLVAASV
ncbi:hypothetical protein TNCV_303141 [Trichonephila clavipes]|nr:hypothetical protein TNCV_303141 [Trichonephila clavipes]